MTVESCTIRSLSTISGTRPAFACGSLSFSVKRHRTVSTSGPLCASAMRVRQQNGQKRRSASAPARSYIVIVMRDSWVSNSSVVTSHAAVCPRFRVDRSSVEARGSGLDRAVEQGGEERSVGVEDDGDARDTRRDLLEQLQPFSH